MRRCLSTNATLTALATAISLTLAALVGSAAPARAFSLVPGENVRTEYGVVQGSVQPDHRRFQGIPFAAPPVGDLRFAAPAAPRPWSGERPARFQGPPCAQGLPILGSLYPSSEDCLYLDVYTPPLARSRDLPVMVWFYGAEVGCTAPAPVIACLRSRSKDALLKPASTRFEAMNVDWRPTVDQKVVPAPTGESFRAGAFNRVPVMVGVLRHALRLGPVSASTYRADVEQAFGPRAPAVLAHSPATGNLDLGLSKIWTDGLFACPAAGSIEGLRRHAPVTYAYEFDDPNPPRPGRPVHALGRLPRLGPLVPVRPGVQHAAALPRPGAAGALARADRLLDDVRPHRRPERRRPPAWPKASTGRLLKLTSQGSTPKPLTVFAADHDCSFWATTP